VTLGRVLFHLQRYGIPAPQLYAFGQRKIGPISAGWFALYEVPAGRPLHEWLAAERDNALRREVLEQAGYLLRQLHDSGCRAATSGSLFWVADSGRVAIGGPEAIRIAKRITSRIRAAELHTAMKQLPRLTDNERSRMERAYRGQA
jgi:hypothetical protein